MSRLAAFVPLLAFVLPQLAHATTDYVEILSGYSHGALNAPQPAYETFPLRVAFGQDAEPVLAHIFGTAPDGRWEFQVEPFLDTVTSPDSNLEAGVAFNLKVSFGHGAVTPYIKAGTGPMYTSQPTLEQSTKYNFGSHGAVGVNVWLDECSALTLETRLRHFSNAGIDEPNSGVNSNYYLLGYLWRVR